MTGYEEMCAEVFLREQGKLFDEPVVANIEEAKEFLLDCMAVVLDTIQDVRDYLEESGMDEVGMSDEEIEETLEVFKLPNGKYLVVEA